jgi:SagB-type dehydrogenase family enzyme
MTALQERNSTKYGDFGYDMLTIEARHMSQNLHLVAESLNKKYCPIFSFNEKKFQDLLYLDESEIVLYMTVLGWYVIDLRHKNNCRCLPGFLKLL